MKRLVFCAVLLCSGLAFGGYTSATLNISGCGGVLSGSRYTSIGSFSPLGGEGMQSASFYNHSGFASGFILQPGTAFNGLPDELNPDNDRDGLQDDGEIMAGSSLYNRDTDSDGLTDPDEVKTYGTSPVLADSDADGMNDAHELVAGTSPTNRNSVLSVACTVLPDEQLELSWFGVQGRAYTFQYAVSLNPNNWQSYPSEIAGTGAPVSVTDTAAASNLFYRVMVRVAE